jgi:hypothetical protein
MDRIQILRKGSRLLFAAAVVLAQVVLAPGAFAQTELQATALAGVSCSNSNNGTGHVLCLEELNNPNGNSPVLGGVSWQPPNSPPPANTGSFNAPIEPVGTVHQMTDVSMPSGSLTGTAGCATTSAPNGNTGTVICAIQGPDNALYGIAIHPQPLGNLTEAQATSPLVPLLTPGQVLMNFNGGAPTGSPCTPVNPCNRVAAIGGKPSCAPSEGNMVICGVLVVLQNAVGSTINDLIGIAFDPRVAASPTNPAILGLANGANFYSNPSCASSKDPNGVVNGGKMFATCGIVFIENYFGATATLFGASFDPRSGYNRGALTVSGSTFLGQDPSCAAPRDNKGAVICAIGVGFGNGYGTGTTSTMLGVAFDPIGRTTSTINLGAPPAGNGMWASFGCASPVDANDNNSVACAAVTSTNMILAINFDPRTGLDPVTKAAPAFAPVTFNDPNGTNATLVSVPSCVPENIIPNQISCVIVDSVGALIGFFAKGQ